MMNKIGLLSILGLCSYTSLAQFDRIITDPIGENPSYVGQSGAQRINCEAFLQKKRNELFLVRENIDKQIISYSDFNKDIGGWGISLANNNVLSSREFNLSSAFSPKISPTEKVTWAPSIGLRINYRYQKESDTFDLGGLGTQEIDKRSVTGSLLLGLTRNTRNLLLGTSISYNPVIGKVEHKADIFFKLNKNTRNNLSSTIGLKHNFIHTGATAIFEVHQLDNLVENNEYHFPTYSMPKQMEFIGTAFWVKYKNISVGIDINYRVWSKDYVFTNTTKGRQQTDLTSMNTSQLAVFYDFKTVSLGIKYSNLSSQDLFQYQYEYTNDEGTIIGEQGGDIGFLYNKLSLGVQWNIPAKTYKPNYKKNKL